MSRIPRPAHPHHSAWDSMCLANRLSYVMNIFPRRLWGFLIIEPIFSSEEMYEVDAYFGYPVRYVNLSARPYWNWYDVAPQRYYDNYRRYLPPQCNVIHSVVNHNVNIVNQYQHNNRYTPISPVSPANESFSSRSKSPTSEDLPERAASKNTCGPKRKLGPDQNDEGPVNPKKRAKGDKEFECVKEIDVSLRKD